MKTLARIEKEPVGLSGSIHYKDKNVQAVHEILGIPYQVKDDFELISATGIAKFGVVAVKFDNGATCYGYVPYDAAVPTMKTLKEVSEMSGVTRAAYFDGNGNQRWAGNI